MSTPSLPARPTFADPREIDDFVATLERFERGELDAEQWRAYRVLQGVYTQRQDGFHMLRIKLPQGIAEAAQLRALAEVATRWSRGRGHVTTRQDLQLHFVRPEHLEPAMRRLAEEGLTSSGACGNAVRNVVACPLAGVSRSEPFDVTPYAEAVTRHFLRHPLSSALPRKFKIAFEGCAEDHVATAIHDLGFRARVRRDAGAERRGFRVTVAGGTSTVCTSARLLHEFLPAEDVLAIAEAVVRVFHARGDRVNRKRNRLKFLVADLGWDGFRALLDAELARVRADGAPTLPALTAAAPEAPPARERPAAPSPAAISAKVRDAASLPPGDPLHIGQGLLPGPGALEVFRRTNVVRQRQDGHSAVTVALPRGDITAAQLEVLADLATAYGDGTARFSNAGRILLRWVSDADVPALHERLVSAGLGRPGAGSAADVVSCPGSELCRLAVTHSRGVAAAIEERVRADHGAAGLAAELPVHVSGCPNGCSQHHLVPIGLQGSVRRVDGRAVPQYFVLLGGGATEDGVRFGRLAAKIPARRMPEAVSRLAGLYLARRSPGERASDFFARAFEDARAAIAPLAELTPETVGAEDLVEPGSTVAFGAEAEEGRAA